MNYVRRTTTHPYGYASVGNADLAFIRISKNASTYIAQSLNVTNWERIDRLSGHRFLCALREPTDRFISSVPETISRTGVFSDTFDVIIDLRILKEMTAICMSYEGDVAKFLADYIGIIERYGFFDAHHEPQHYFLIEAREAGVDIEFFDVSDADQMLGRLAESYKLKAGRRNSSRQKVDNKFFQSDAALRRIVTDMHDFRRSELTRDITDRLEALYREDYILVSEALTPQSLQY